MHPTLHQLQKELTFALSELPESDLHARSVDRPASWSIFQIVQHLLLTYASTEASFEARLQNKDLKRSAITPGQQIARFFVLRLGWIPIKREAPPAVNPGSASPIPSITAGQILSDLQAALLSMDSILSEAERQFGSSRCQSHFALGSMSVRDWRRFHLVHGRHHIRQIHKLQQIRRT